MNLPNHDQKKERATEPSAWVHRRSTRARVKLMFSVRHGRMGAGFECQTQSPLATARLGVCSRCRGDDCVDGDASTNPLGKVPDPGSQSPSPRGRLPWSPTAAAGGPDLPSGSGQRSQKCFEIPVQEKFQSTFTAVFGEARNCLAHRGGRWRQSLPREGEQLGWVFVQDICVRPAKANLATDSGRRRHFAVDTPFAPLSRLDHAPNLCLPEKLNTPRPRPHRLGCCCGRTRRMSCAQAQA